jgi:C4-dicarboxylate transporter/malic acid transport protein
MANEPNEKQAADDVESHAATMTNGAHDHASANSHDTAVSRTPSRSPDIVKASDADALSNNKHTKPHNNAGAAAAQTTTFRNRLRHFTWSWFSCTMATGAIAVVLANTPFRFTGLDVIAKIFFILDLVLFVLFTAAIIYRFCINPRVLVRSLRHPKEALFFGAFFVSIALILNLTQTYAVPVVGSWLVVALRVCFWVYVALALCVAVFQYATLFVAERLPPDSAMPAWVFPVYPFLVVGPLAGVLLQTQPEGSGLTIWIAAVMFQGLGWTIAVFMYTIYIMRLAGSDLPDPSSRPGMYISVGPTGYTAAGLVSLGNMAPQVIPPGWLAVNSLNVAEVIKTMAIGAALFIWLLAVWFFALSSVAVLAGACEKKRKMEFTLTWWGFVFPNAGLVLATINIGNALQSDGIKAVTSAMTVLLVVAWFGVAVMNVRAVLQGKILWRGRDEDEGMRLD